MASEGAVGVVLVLEDPLARHHVSTRRMRYKSPSAVVDERLVLLRHGSTPVGISQPTTKFAGTGEMTEVVADKFSRST